jgi:hypothetical protein
VPATTVAQLLCVPKRVRLPERVVTKSHQSHRAWDLNLDSDNPGEFSVYVRVNVRLPESFSIGLRYRAERGPLNVILRINGDHGSHTNPDGFIMDGAHVHMPNGVQLQAWLPASPWSQGPPFAAPLGVGFLTLVDAWEILATSTSIENTDDVRSTVVKVQNKIASAQLEISL